MSHDNLTIVGPNSHHPPDKTRRSCLCRVRRCELSRPDTCVLRRSASSGRTAPPDTDQTQNAPVWRSGRLSSHRHTGHDKTVVSWCDLDNCYILTCSDFKFSVGDSLELSRGNPVHPAEADATQRGQFCRVWRGGVIN